MLLGDTLGDLSPVHALQDWQGKCPELSKQRAYNHTGLDIYSVAQYSLYVASLQPNTLWCEALLDDAAEAYSGDVVSPLKKIMP